MKKFLYVTLSLLLVISLTAFAIDYNSSKETMGLEEAKEKFFRLMDEYDMVCFVSHGIPLEFSDYIREAWESTLCLEDTIDSKSISETFTYFEFYQMKLAEYLAESLYALPSWEIQYLATRAALTPDDTIILTTIIFLE